MDTCESTSTYTTIPGRVVEPAGGLRKATLCAVLIGVLTAVSLLINALVNGRTPAIAPAFSTLAFIPSTIMMPPPPPPTSSLITKSKPQAPAYTLFKNTRWATERDVKAQAHRDPERMQQLLEYLQSSMGVASNGRVYDAMLSVDRGMYVDAIMGSAYEDHPQPIGFGQTISAPHMHALCLEYLKDYLQPGMRALDVGSGSGYLSVTMAELSGDVVGIEDMPGLVERSLENIKADGRSHLLTEGKLKIVQGDGSKGYPSKAPFSAIHVGAAAPKVPKALLEQLASPGRMVIPVGPQHDYQQLVVIDKDAEGRVKQNPVVGVGYVPLRMDE